MDSWLKAKAGELAQAATQGLAEGLTSLDDLQQKASQLAEGLVQKLDASGVAGSKNLEFEEGELGFTLEGVYVVDVDPEEQALRLGVEVGDRLIGVAGYSIPDFQPGDKDGEKQAIKLVRQYLQDMPPPFTLTFMPPRDEEAEAAIQEAEPRTGAAGVMNGDPSTHDAADDGLQDGWLGAEAEDIESEPAVSVSKEPSASQVPLAGEGRAADVDPETLEATALRAELLREREERRQCATQLQDAHAQNAANLEAEKRLKAAHQKKVNELQKALAKAKAENKEILLGSSKTEADSYEAMEALENRGRLLEDEVASLRAALDAANQTIAELRSQKEATEKLLEESRHDLKEALRTAEAQQAVAVEEIQSRLSKEVDSLSRLFRSAENRAMAAEYQADAQERELQGFRDAHDVELELLREERTELERNAARSLEEQEQRASARAERAARELEQVREELRAAKEHAAAQTLAAEAAKDDARAASLEAATLRMEAAQAAQRQDQAAEATLEDADGEDGDEVFKELAAKVAAPKTPKSPAHKEDVPALYQRIEVLEKRCVTLQKKLTARPVITTLDIEASVSLQQRPSWEPWVVSNLGPKAGELAVLMYSVPDAAFRTFTRQLLKNGLRLWSFYAHLLVLYTIALSCYSQSALEVANPLDDIAGARVTRVAVNAASSSAVAAAAPAALASSVAGAGGSTGVG